MVEHIMRNPSAAPISESALRTPALPSRGPCLICGDWIEGAEGEDVYGVALTHGSEASEHVAHAGCLARVAHASAHLAGAQDETMPDVLPENYLDSKFRTPDGR